ncbi:MAG: hypothetical protein NY202_05265 [Mollicutes bacterium UO1]
MVKNNQIPIEVNKKPFEIVQEVSDEIKNKNFVEQLGHVEEVQLPKLSEITGKYGKVKLPPELINRLRDPNARFDNDLVVFPLQTDY